jgi:hypothetical protein
MLFDQDEIERLSPAARVEVQDFYVRKHFADRHVTLPERRARKQPMQTEMADAGTTAADVERADRRRWPRVWYRNDSSRPSAVLVGSAAV